jgi:hypothetical protein
VTASRALRLGLALALLVATAALSLLDIRDFDYWWHLKTGELILANGAVPTADTYTYTVPGARYVDVHWLFQILVHLLHGTGGHAAVVVAVFVVIAAAVGLSAAAASVSRPDRPALVVFCVALGLLAASDRIMPRPEIATLLLLCAEVYLLERWLERGGRAIWLVPPLFLLWANLHGLFAVGLGVIALALAGEALDAVLPGRRPLDRGRAQRLAAVLALSLAACLVNPNGWELLAYPFEQLRMIGTPGQRSRGATSMELLPLTYWPYLRPQIVLGFLALAALAVVGLLAEGRARRARHVLYVAVFGALGVLAQRNTALFLAVGPLVAVRGLGAWLDRHALPARLQQAGALAVVAGLAALAADVWRGEFHLRIGDSRSPGLSIVRPLYPIGAAEWIAEHRPSGPIYHNMADGAYLIWRLTPDYKVMADGRLEVFGAKLRELDGTTPDVFRRLDARYRFGLALLAYGLLDYPELMEELRRDPAWRLVHADAASVLFARVPPEGAPWPAVDPADPELFPPLPEERSVDDLLLRVRRVRFYAAFGPMFRALEARGYIDTRYAGLFSESDAVAQP